MAIRWFTVAQCYQTPPLVKRSRAVMFWGKNIYDNDKCINIYGFVILHVRDLFEKDFRKF